MIDEAGLLDLVYKTVLSPDAWHPLLARLSTTFRCHFADVFARTTNWSQYQGLAHGLDEDDYQDVFLGRWTKRNAWAEKHPVERAGEVVTTSDFMLRSELERTEMFNDYLRQRDLNEGLRLATWAGEGWVNDISLIRAWSDGPFTRRERRLGKWLVPHLGRAATMARAFRPANGMLVARDYIDALEQPALLVEPTGLVLRHNQSAEALARSGAMLRIAGRQVLAAEPNQSETLLTAIARASRSPYAAAQTVRLRASDNATLVLLVLPVMARQSWPIPDEGAVLLLASTPESRAGLSAEALARRFGLTPAETALALQVANGESVETIATRNARSRNTIRTHLHRLMQKTQTNRQAELVHVLLGAQSGQIPIASFRAARMHSAG